MVVNSIFTLSKSNIQDQKVSYLIKGSPKRSFFLLNDLVKACFKKRAYKQLQGLQG